MRGSRGPPAKRNNDFIDQGPLEAGPLGRCDPTLDDVPYQLWNLHVVHGPSGAGMQAAAEMPVELERAGGVRSTRIREAGWIEHRGMGIGDHRGASGNRGA